MGTIMTAALLAAETSVTPVSLDFSEAFTTALNSINADYAKYALIAIPIALGLWAAPKVIRMVMKFFNSLTR